MRKKILIGAVAFLAAMTAAVLVVGYHEQPVHADPGQVVIEGMPIVTGSSFVVIGKPASGSAECTTISGDTTVYDQPKWIVILGDGAPRLAFWTAAPANGTHFSVQANNGGCTGGTTNYTVQETLNP